MIPVEQFEKQYSEVKRTVLLDEDIKLLRSLNEDINRFSKVSDKNELIQLESDLATHAFKLGAVFGRLSAHYNAEKDDLEEKRIEMINEEIKSLPPTLKGEPRKIGGIGSAERRATLHYKKEIQRLSILEGIIEEYKQKLYAVSRVQVAVEHRIWKLTGTNEVSKPPTWIED